MKRLPSVPTPSLAETADAFEAHLRALYPDSRDLMGMLLPQDLKDIIAFLDANTDETVRFVIAQELRWQIRDFLDHQNITERMVYPGLDGLSEWLGRHYFVR